MKIKAIIITACLVAGAGAATSFFVRRSNEANVKVVEVVSVPSVNSASYGMGDSETVSGTIISRDTQVVPLDTSHELVDVYVQQGDRVKKGDKLLEYDMLGDELKEEMQELTKLGLELSLEGMKKDLEIMKSGRMPESLAGSDDSDFSADDSDDEDDEDDSSDSGSTAVNTDSSGRSTGRVQKQGSGAVGAADTKAAMPAARLSARAIPRTDYVGAMDFLGMSSDGDLPGLDLQDELVDDEDYRSYLCLLAAGGALEKLGIYLVDGKVVDRNGREYDDEAVQDIITYLAQHQIIDGTGLGVNELNITELIGNDEEGALLQPDAIAADGSGAGNSDSIFEDDGDENTDTQDAIVNGTTLFMGENTPALVGGSPEPLPGEETPALTAGTAGNLIEGDDEETPALVTGAEEAPSEDGNDQNGGGTVGSAEEIIPDGDSSGEIVNDGDDTQLPEDGANPDAGTGTQPTSDENGDNTDPEAPVPGDAIPVADELETNFEGDVFVDDDSEIITTTIEDVNGFLSSVNAITQAVDSGWGAISGQMSAINSAMDTFRNNFGEASEFQKVDLFGETITVTAYNVSSATRSQVGDATASVMQTAYDRLCAYHFINTMMTLNPGNAASSSLDANWAVNNETALRAAVTEYASLPDSLFVYNPSTQSFEFSSQYGAMNNKIFSGESMVEFLRGAVLSLNTNYVMEEPTDTAPVISTEGKLLQDNLGDSDDGSDDFGYSAQELAEAIKEQEKNIKETELQIREAELGIQEYKKILDGRVVYATMDGIVKSAGSTDSSSGSNAFITITGKEGLYVKGTINELALETVKVGDVITGTSYETGNTFTAEIVEISEYPSDSNSSMYYGYGDENTNSSYYPFYAYIENADGLEVDSYVDLSLSNTNPQGLMDDESGGSLSLEEYFIRKDGNGRSYCFVRGKDGLLEKRYLETGANNWGIVTIKSGLSPDDYIAFPYGDGVEEGALTEKVESLKAVDGDIY